MKDKLSLLMPAALIAAAIGALGLLHIQPQPGEDTVGLVFAPGTSFAEAAYHVTQAGGDVLSPGVSGNIVIARLAPGRGMLPDSAPLWFSFTPRGTGTCFTPSERAVPSLPAFAQRSL
ncbi:PhoH family protein [Tepidicaulis marinus]|uniref:PhoH family protein n=1 Tax=Tepidicaulis marinus TaxID=1333998 RepID=A0A081BDT6_9HYPH|nr:hypothetical protein [Tepidicaulis marinus]GAK46204.1 PhoH family protein [Tepidicaulis marinus]